MPNPSPTTPASLGPPPRVVKLKEIVPRWKIIIIALFLLPFYAFAFFLTGDVILSLLTPVLGTPIPGSTISTEIDVDDDGHKTYRLHYTYQLSGQTIQTWDKLQLEDYKLFHTQPHPQPITVYYLPLGPLSRDNPNSLVSQFGRIFCLIIFTIIWDTLVFGGALYCWLKHRQIKRLLQHGTATSGVIVSKRKVDSSDSPDHYITYSYTHPFTGQPVAIECHIDSEPWESTTTNQTVTVIYDPSNPHKSLVYEFSYYKIL